MTGQETPVSVEKRGHLRSTALVALALLLTALLTAGLPACTGPGASLESLSIGLPALEQNALLYVADDQKLFAAQGLNVTLREYDTGVTAIDALLNGDVDLAEAAEFPFVGAALNQAPITIIASNDRFENDYLLARRDRGIANISDLKGKRIGVTLKTINEFYLARLLDLHGLAMRDVKPVDVKPNDFSNALASGGVDALIAWQPYVHQMSDLGIGPLVIWPAQSNQSVYGIVITTPTWLGSHKLTTERFLRALARAQEYVVRNQEQARSIVEKRLRYDRAYVESVWEKHEFTLSLDFSLLAAMNDEARWVIRNDSRAANVPDWSDYIYLDGLKAVQPSAVNITH